MQLQFLKSFKDSTHVFSSKLLRLNCGPPINLKHSCLEWLLLLFKFSLVFSILILFKAFISYLLEFSLEHSLKMFDFLK
jgi:hypothetical protein